MQSKKVFLFILNMDNTCRLFSLAVHVIVKIGPCGPELIQQCFTEKTNYTGWIKWIIY